MLHAQPSSPRTNQMQSVRCQDTDSCMISELCKIISESTKAFASQGSVCNNPSHLTKTRFSLTLIKRTREMRLRGVTVHGRTGTASSRDADWPSTFHRAPPKWPIQGSVDILACCDSSTKPLDSTDSIVPSYVTSCSAC
jgi:hypothetical protein